MHRRSFTLVELMVTIAIIGIVSSMMIVALNSASADAKRSRSIGQVQRLNQAILGLYEEVASRRLPRDYEDSGGTAEPAGGYRFRSVAEASAFRLALMRDHLRIVLPDRRSDVLDKPAQIYAPVRNRLNAVFSPTIYARRDYMDGIRTRFVNRLLSLTGSTTATLSTNWTAENESSECLYLILVTNAVGGIPMIEDFRSSDIQDTDGDGVPEIVDAWGTPIHWMRWPAGYWLTYNIRDELNSAIRATRISDTRLAMGRDSIDYLNSDQGFVSSSKGRSFELRPVVVSAGPDQQFDMLFSPDYSGASTAMNPLSYGRMVWPTVTGEYPDPFCRQYVVYDYLSSSYDKYATTANTGLVGAYFDADADSDDQSVDNIFSVIQ